MIKLTDRAASELRQVLTSNQAPDDQGVKLVRAESGGLAMMIDEPGQGDAVIEQENRTLLIVDGGIAPQLDGATLDVQDGGPDAPGPRFTLRGPEA